MEHGDDRLEGWKEIAFHIRRSVKTARRWERIGMPVRRMEGKKGPIVFAFRSEIDEWREEREINRDSPRGNERWLTWWRQSARLAPRPITISAVMAILVIVATGLWGNLGGDSNRSSDRTDVAGTSASVSVLADDPFPQRPATISVDQLDPAEKEVLEVRGVAPPYFDVVGYWRFDEVDGTVARDASGNQHDGRIVGARRTRGLGPSSSGLRFDGIDDFVYVEDRPSLDVRGAITIEAIVSCDDQSHGYIPLVFKMLPGISNTGYALQLGSDCRLTTYFGTPRIEPGTWHHVAYQADGTIARLYVDGALVAEADEGESQPSTASNVHLTIGGSPLNHGYFRGAIDEVRVSRGIVRPRDFIPFCPGPYVRLVNDRGDSADFDRIQEAVDRASPGSRVLVGTGDYQERVVISRKHRLEVITGCAARVNGFDVEESESVTIKGFDVDATGQGVGISLRGGADRLVDVAILDSQIHSAEEDGISVEGAAFNVEVAGNVIRENGRHGVYYDAEDGEHFHVKFNWIAENGGDGVHFGRAQNISIHDNTIRDQENGYAIARARFDRGTRIRHITLANNTLIYNGGLVVDTVSSADLQNYDQYLDSLDVDNVTTCGCEEPAPERFEIVDGWLEIREGDLDAILAGGRDASASHPRVVSLDYEADESWYGTGYRLRLLDSAGEELRSFEFANTVSQAALLTTERRTVGSSTGSPSPPVARNGNEDGATGIQLLAIGHGGGEGPRRGHLVMQTTTGEELWALDTFDSERMSELRARGIAHSDHFVISDLFALQRAGRTVLVVIAQDEEFTASRVLLVDASDGAVLGDYWHFGKIGYGGARVFDLDGDGEEELIAAGYNNALIGEMVPLEETMPVVFALDLEQLSGSGSFQSWPPRFGDLPVELPRWYFLVPQAIDHDGATIRPVEADDYDRDGVFDVKISTYDRRFYYFRGDGDFLGSTVGDAWRRAHGNHEVPAPVRITDVDVGLTYLWAGIFNEAAESFDRAAHGSDESIRELAVLWAGRAARFQSGEPYPTVDGDGLAVATSYGSMSAELEVTFTHGKTSPLLVAAVEDGSRAAVAGLVPGDQVFGVGLQPIHGIDDLRYLLKIHDRDAPLLLDVARGGERRYVSVMLPQRSR